MSSVMLPLRIGRPSLTLDPVFSLLYENKEAAFARLINSNAPLEPADVLNNADFMGYLLSKEPGPKVQYENLRPALSAMRGFLIASPSGQKLIDFYKELLKLQGQWMFAAAEMLAFDMFIKITLSLHFERDDKALMAHVTQLVPDAALKITTCAFFSQDQFNMLVQGEKMRRYKAQQDAAEQLFNLKVSKAFWHQHSKLLSAIEHTEKRLQEFHAQNSRRVAERQAREALVQARNDATATQQMGMNGLENHSAQAESAIRQYVNMVNTSYFPQNNAVEV